MPVPLRVHEGVIMCELGKTPLTPSLRIPRRLNQATIFLVGKRSNFRAYMSLRARAPCPNLVGPGCILPFWYAVYLHLHILIMIRTNLLGRVCSAFKGCR